MADLLDDLPFLDDLPEQEREVLVSNQQRWQMLADQMRRRPHAWRIMHRASWRSTITALRNGEYKAFRPATDWEFALRAKPGEEKGVLLGKFVGAPKPPGFEEGPQP